jgi:hypothetical protein
MIQQQEWPDAGQVYTRHDTRWEDIYPRCGYLFWVMFHLELFEKIEHYDLKKS